MDVHWQHKRKRSAGMTNSDIDEMYAFAMNNGALGGKLIGAGGGGFLMLYAREKSRLAGCHAGKRFPRGSFSLRFPRHKNHFAGVMPVADDFPVAILAGGMGNAPASIDRTYSERVGGSGRPSVLEHQLALLKRNGLDRVVLCVGYLGHKVCDTSATGRASVCTFGTPMMGRRSSEQQAPYGKPFVAWR